MRDTVLMDVYWNVVKDIRELLLGIREDNLPSKTGTQTNIVHLWDNKNSFVKRVCRERADELGSTELEGYGVLFEESP